jgi:hypothetical protein
MNTPTLTEYLQLDPVVDATSSAGGSVQPPTHAVACTHSHDFSLNCFTCDQWVRCECGECQTCGPIIEEPPYPMSAREYRKRMDRQEEQQTELAIDQHKFDEWEREGGRS